MTITIMKWNIVTLFMNTIYLFDLIYLEIASVCCRTHSDSPVHRTQQLNIGMPNGVISLSRHLNVTWRWRTKIYDPVFLQWHLCGFAVNS